MGSRGRRSGAEIAVISQVEAVISTERLAPPLHLNDAMRAVWIEVVNDQPAQAFSGIHIPLLEMYCAHVVKSRLLNAEIENFEIEWLRDEDGLKRYDRLTAIAERESRAASSLATRLRITRQSMTDPKTIGRASRSLAKSAKPWQRPTTVEPK